MPADDWALGQNLIDVPNEARREGQRHGAYVCHDPEADYAAMVADDADLHLVHANAHDYAMAHPCDCDGVCTCESRPQGEET